jgi:hypothetical protein
VTILFGVFAEMPFNADRKYILVARESSPAPSSHPETMGTPQWNGIFALLLKYVDTYGTASVYQVKDASLYN